jgi:hypothetical protein
MPYLPDGTPVDLVLNPLGVPEPHERRADPRGAPRVGAYELGRSSSDGGRQRRPARGSRRSSRTIYKGDASTSLVDGSTRRGPRFAKKLQARRLHLASPVFDGATKRRSSAALRSRAPLSGQSVLFDGRTGDAFDRGRDRRRHVHAEAAPPGRRQDPRALHRPVLARHAAAPRRQGPVRRSASRRDGSLGDGGLRRGLRAAGVPHGQERRRPWAAPGCTRPSSRASTRCSSGLPESFNVLMKELQSLCLNVELSTSSSSSRRAAAPATATGPERRSRRGGRGRGPLCPAPTAKAVTPFQRPSGQREVVKDIFSFFEKPKDPLSFSAIRISLASPGEDPGVVPRRGEEAGDDQLPHVQAGAGRPLLREDLRAGEGLRVQLRQVQAHEAPRDRVREVRRRGDPVQGAP